MRVTVTISAVLFTAATLLAAPATKPASTRPAGESDGSGPRAALLLRDKLTMPGKPETALPFYHATATRERVFARHLAERDAAVASLHKSATAKFGKAAADAIVQPVNGTTVPEINAARIEVAGDQAKVWFQDHSEPTVMVRVGEEWKISVKERVRRAENLPALRGSFSKLAARVNDIAKGIETGRYASPEAAKNELAKAQKEVFGSPSAKAMTGEDDE